LIKFKFSSKCGKSAIQLEQERSIKIIPNIQVLNKTNGVYRRRSHN